ncbi:MAG TPA: phage holin family protein [Egibacteraceae bacterium]|nr:phage holin family protein [Egibacteraceae bacterium]
MVRAITDRFGTETTVGAGAAAKAVAEDTRELVRAEVALAKAELTQAVREKAIGAGMLTAAGVAAWLGLQALLIAAGFALALVMPGWAAALVVAAALVIVAATMALIGRRKAATPVRLDITKSTVEEDVAWTKGQLQRR